MKPFDQSKPYYLVCSIQRGDNRYFRYVLSKSGQLYTSWHRIPVRDRLQFLTEDKAEKYIQDNKSDLPFWTAIECSSGEF